MWLIDDIMPLHWHVMIHIITVVLLSNNNRKKSIFAHNGNVKIALRKKCAELHCKWLICCCLSFTIRTCRRRHWLRRHQANWGCSFQSYTYLKDPKSGYCEVSFIVLHVHSILFSLIHSYSTSFLTSMTHANPHHSISSTPGSCSRSVGSEASKEASGVSVWEYVPCSTGGPKPNSNPMSGMAAISSPDPSLLILTRCSVRAARGRWTGRASRDSRKADKICRSCTRKKMYTVCSIYNIYIIISLKYDIYSYIFIISYYFTITSINKIWSIDLWWYL